MNFDYKEPNYEQYQKNGMTFFYLEKRCLQCYTINSIESKNCHHCKFSFVREATKEEKDEIDKLKTSI